MIKQIYKFNCEGCKVCCSNERLGNIVGKVIKKEELKKIVFLREELFDTFYEKKETGYLIGKYCKHYDEKTGKCKIYNQRPPECILYPFLVFKKENRLIIAIDNECPDSKRFLKDLNNNNKFAIDQINNILNNIKDYNYLIYDYYLLPLFNLTVIIEFVSQSVSR